MRTFVHQVSKHMEMSVESTERDSFKIYRVGLRALDDNLQGIDGINWYYYDVRLEV